MTLCRMMPSSFAGFSREDAEKELARIEAEKAAAEKKRLEDLARKNAGQGNVTAPLSDVSGLDGVVFGASSPVRLNQPDAVRFAEKDGILQSAGEAVYARKQVGDKASWDYQRTRTGAFYVIENGKVCVAFDDIADKIKNVVIALAQEGCDKNAKGEELFIDGSVLDDVLARAKDTNRFLEVPEQSPIAASVLGSPCEYELNSYFVAVLGKMIGVNAELIRSKNFDTGKLFMPNALTVRSAVSSGKGLVRPVGLGDDYCNGIFSVNANNVFNDDGRARGVRSAQSEGGAQ